MDLTSLVTPGAQSLVTAILSDSWVQLRSVLAERWARRHGAEAAPDAAAVERAGHELEAARDQALACAGAAAAAVAGVGAEGGSADAGERMRLFLAGYLAGQLAARPELAETVAALPALLGGAAPTTAITNTNTNTTVNTTTHTSAVRNSVSGRGKNVAQLGSVDGGVHFGRP